MIFEACRWPLIDEPYRQAIIHATRFVLDRVNPEGIVVSGSIIRGNPDASSDLDVYVVNAALEQQLLQRRFNGVPTEIFISPLVQIKRYFISEAERGRPSTAHMFATGFVVYDPDGVIAELCERSRMLLAAGPRPSSFFLQITAYDIVCMLDDARDLLDCDPATSQLFLNRAVDEAVQFAFWLQREWIPRSKELFDELARLDAELGQQVRDFYESDDLAAQFDLAEQIVERTTGHTTFYNWDGPLEQVDQ